MKKLFISFLVVLIFSFAVNLTAQTPQYYNYNTGTSSNSFPFNVTGGKAVNTLILAGELNQPTPVPSGMAITKVYFRTSTAATKTYTNLHVLLAQDVITALTSGTFYPGPYDTVYFAASATLTSTVGGWMEITLDHSFPYDPTKSLILFVGQCGRSGTGQSVYNTSNTPTVRRVWSIGGCPFAPYASMDGSTVNFGVDVVPAVSNVWSEQTSPVTTALYSVSAVSNDVAWACGAGGKVVRTTNKGVTWTNVSGNLPTAYSFYAIYAWDANIALATASPAAGDYVYRTSNGGVNWTQVFNLAGGFGNGLWMTDANTAYHVGDPVGGNWMLKKSTDGGVTWTDWATVASTAAGWNNAFMMVGNNVWMGTNANYLMYSSNLGVNWSQQTTTFTNQYAVWFNNANVGLCAYNALNVTTNSGTNWSALTSPLTANAGGITGLGSEWWVAPQSTAVYFSGNNGSTWATQYTAPDGAFYHITYSRTGNTVWGVRSNGKISRYGTPLTGITPVTVNVPDNYSMLQNYPNPFNPVTKIEFAIPKSGLVLLKVYDLLGREVASLVNAEKNAGSYIVDFDASNLTSGIYFYKLEVNGYTDVKKMTILK
jgi:photosystem II stability/assembly factor-like uncharacterized protein